MTETVRQARILNNISKRNKCILQIGHTWSSLIQLLKKLKSQLKSPEFIEVHRLCKFNPRANDVSEKLDS